MAAKNGDTIDTTPTTRRRGTSRRRKTAARGRGRGRQNFAIARGGTDTATNATAEAIVDALNGVGFLARPMNAARLKHVTNLVDITLRGRP